MKRARAPNFSPEEKVKLLNVIGKYKNTVENKKTDATTWQQKEACWRTIANEFNSSTGVLRTLESIKHFYENQKRNVNKRVAADKREMLATGGGKAKKVFVDDPTLELTMAIVNKKTLYGLTNACDGDAPTCNASKQVKMVEFEQKTSQSDVGMTEHVNEENDIYENIIIEIDSPSPEGETKSITDWGHHNPNVLKEPLSDNLKKAISSSKAVPPSSTQKNNFSVLDTGRRSHLNSATSSVARKYEDVADIKLQVGGIHLSLMKKWEAWFDYTIQEMKETKMKRDKHEEEIRELESRKAKLDIAIKQAQLQHLDPNYVVE